MRFKNYFKSLFICLCVVACSSESIPRHQKATLEGSSAQVENEVELKEFTQFDESHKAINELIATGDIKKVTQALSLVEEQLFSPIAKDPNMYTSSEYTGYINSFVKVFVFWKSQKKVEPFNKLFLNSLEKFKAQFVNDCINEDIQNCEMLRSSLVQNRSTVAVINHLIEQEKDFKAKLRLVGFAYDLAGRRTETRLDDLYISTVLAAVKEKKAGNGVVSDDEIRRHTVNMIALFNNMDWSRDNKRTTELYVEIAPWEYVGTTKTTLDYLRSELVKELPAFYRNNEVVQKGLKAVVDKKVKQFVKNSFDLSKYPAFNNIKIQSIGKDSPLLTFLALSVYLQEIDLKEASLFLSKFEDKAAATEKIYSLSKSLVRWDIAQLSIDSTKKLSTRFGSQEVKTKSFVQETLDYSRQLVPMWTEFHSIRLNSIRKFINANQKYMTKTDDDEVRDFFASVNRNILKTTVYPNMLAFMYYMTKTEWKDKVQVWFWEIDLDSTDVFDFMMTGNYYYPWFNFTNLKEDAGYDDNTRTSLFRSEILDSFYYLLSTKTAQEYDINVDEMVKTISETILKKRLPKFEEILNVQKKIYFSGDKAPNRFMDWCNAVSKNQKSKEIIPFYYLKEQLTPYTRELRATKGVFNPASTSSEDEEDQEKLVVSAFPPLYYDDIYKEEGFLKHIRVTDVNDQFKMEMLPILQTSSQLIKIAERLNKKYPSSMKVSLKKSKKYHKDMLKFKQAYIGSQITIAEMMGDCNHVAGTESRRRAMALARAEYKYLEKIVHPLILKATRGEISASQANNIIRSIHKNHRGFLDEFIVVNDKTASYKASRQGYMLRVRELLINGISIDNPHTGKVTIPAIVGRQMEIPIRSGLLEDENNPYFNINGNLRNVRDIKFDTNLSAKDFATAGVRMETDEIEGIFYSYKYSKWDKFEVSSYFKVNRRKIEFLVQRLQLNGETYIDFSDESCRDFTKDLDKKCYKVNNYSLDQLAKVMNQIFQNVELDEEKTKYMELIGYKGFIASSNMSLQLKIDEQGVYDFNIDALPYSDPEGFFDSAIRMAKSDYLGILYTTEFDVFAQKQAGDDAGGVSCSSVRYSISDASGCYWETVRERAIQFFISRKKREGIIFNFDKKILEENYEYVKERVKSKFQLPIDIENQGQELLEKHRAGNLEYSYDLYKKPKELKALSLSNLYNEVTADKFFVEETESFFMSEPNWDKYLNNK